MRHDSYLLPDPDVSLLNQDSGVVDGLGKSELENLGVISKLNIMDRIINTLKVSKISG